MGKRPTLVLMDNTMQKVYFLSRHSAANEMLDQLSEKLGDFEFTQFTGTFSEFSGSSDGITFKEIPLDGTEPVMRRIPANAVVVAVMPPQLQMAFLNAKRFSGNTAILLQAMTRRRLVTTGTDGKPVFDYCGLSEVKSVVIETELYAGEMPGPAENRR